MINHVRTLLVNETAKTAANISSVYTPPNYIPVTVPVEFRTLQAAIFPPGFTLAERITLVDSLMCILHTGELERYSLLFDPRVTYAQTAPAQLIDICSTTTQLRTALTALLSRLERLPTMGFIHTHLFQWPTYVGPLGDLAQIYTASTEGLLRLGALILAYAYQLERKRIGSP